MQVIFTFSDGSEIVEEYNHTRQTFATLRMLVARMKINVDFLTAVTVTRHNLRDETIAPSTEFSHFHGLTIAELETAAIKRALAKNKTDKQAAKQLGISARCLVYKMHKLGIVSKNRTPRKNPGAWRDEI